MRRLSKIAQRWELFGHMVLIGSSLFAANSQPTATGIGSARPPSSAVTGRPVTSAVRSPRRAQTATPRRTKPSHPAPSREFPDALPVLEARALEGRGAPDSVKHVAHAPEVARASGTAVALAPTAAATAAAAATDGPTAAAFAPQAADAVAKQWTGPLPQWMLASPRWPDSARGSALAHGSRSAAHRLSLLPTDAVDGGDEAPSALGVHGERWQLRAMLERERWATVQAQRAWDAAKGAVEAGGPPARLVGAMSHLLREAADLRAARDEHARALAREQAERKRALEAHREARATLELEQARELRDLKARCRAAERRAAESERSLAEAVGAIERSSKRSAAAQHATREAERSVRARALA